MPELTPLSKRTTKPAKMRNTVVIPKSKHARMALIDFGMAVLVSLSLVISVKSVCLFWSGIRWARRENDFEPVEAHWVLGSIILQARQCATVKMLKRRELVNFVKDSLFYLEKTLPLLGFLT